MWPALLQVKLILSAHTESLISFSGWKHCRRVDALALLGKCTLSVTTSLGGSIRKLDTGITPDSSCIFFFLDYLSLFSYYTIVINLTHKWSLHAETSKPLILGAVLRTLKQLLWLFWRINVSIYRKHLVNTKNNFLLLSHVCVCVCVLSPSVMSISLQPARLFCP